MKFGFMPARGTTDTIFIHRQLQEKHLARSRKLYFAFVDLEKAFDRVPRKVIWRAIQKLGFEQYIEQFVQAMYNNTRSKVRVNNTYSDELGVTVSKLEFIRVQDLALSYIHHCARSFITRVLHWDTLRVVC